MRSRTKVLLVVLAAAGAWAAFNWPRLREVEAGRTPEYPDLRVREYAASPNQVTRAAREAIARLPGWSLVGSGSGPVGSQIRARHRSLAIKEEIVVMVQTVGRASRVSVRSRSETLPWDFGQNARNIRQLLAELDRVLAPSRREAGVN